MNAARPTPWSIPGWKTEADTWISGELARLGIAFDNPSSDVKMGSISCVLRSGPAYFKVASKLPLFVNEATVTQGLSGLFPGLIPSPLAIHPERGWLLLSDFGSALSQEAPLSERCAVMRAFGELQASAAPHKTRLISLGCIDRRLPRLKSQIDSWLETLDLYAPLEADELDSLRKLTPRLKFLCDEMAKTTLPDTLVHGDMHLGNVAKSHGTFLFFDWTDACVAHPFTDLLNILHENDATARDAMLSAYFEPWQAHLPMPKLFEHWQHFAPLCALHQGISYQHIVINGFEGAREQFAKEILFWPRKILELMTR